MEEYFASLGSKNVLMCKSTDEAVIFDNFGGIISKCSYKEGLMMCGTGYVSECNFCSISGRSSTDMEVYYDGMRKKLSGVHSMLFNKIQNECWSMLITSTPFRLKGEDDIPITILVFKRNVSLKDFSERSGIGYSQGWLDV